jgi:acyl dehydratase
MVKIELARSAAGKWSRQSEAVIAAEAVYNYAQAVNDTNPLYADGTVPPVYPAVLGVPIASAQVSAILGREHYDFGGVHGEQELQVFRPLQMGTTVRIRSRLIGVHPKPSGTTCVSEIEMTDAGGELLNRQYSTLFLRGALASREFGPRIEWRDTVARTLPAREVRYLVTADQSLRYARASGDFGAYALDQRAAEDAGFSRPILHGLCTMAFAARGVIDLFGAADPTRLRRLGVRFAAPLYPGQPITIRARSVDEDGVRRIGFDVFSGAGVAVISRGRAEIVASTTDTSSAGENG